MMDERERREHLELAKRYERERVYDKAAKFFEYAGHYARAGELYREIGNPFLAARCFALAGRIDDLRTLLPTLGSPYALSALAPDTSLPVEVRTTILRWLEGSLTKDPDTYLWTKVADLWESLGRYDHAWGQS